ncbi:SDR family oxidoreductase [Lacimicrobium alkaliphilum]|uniref:Short-chain dehydrogenase n=1 Tax=Lacimicrobium alkaliphilum TaxID=1526571 RepID=A0ABQ1RA23_9ALTE|nr:SDR family oxidoreductase [Lacimicrobium alkaliphilum]GGD60109.1 short-chain dehydrogenase [Lacimicrobium alkaliphilum]
MLRKNILITGASSGLGWGMALEFARQGRNLALCARRTDRLESLKQEIAAIDPTIKVSLKALDVNDHGQVFEVFHAFKQEFGTLDRIIINAGMGKGASIGTGYFEANKQTAMTNFVAAIAQSEAAMEIFREQNHGHLVGMSSFSAIRGFRRALTAYAATKAGLSTLMEGIRVDVLNKPIVVSTIHPGFIRSEINEKVEKVPFIVDRETGCRALVKAIEKEKASCFVPSWPWSFMAPLIKIAPLSVIKRFS